LQNSSGPGKRFGVFAGSTTLASMRKHRLVDTLKGIIGQRLIRTKDGGRVAACEVMVTTGRIKDFTMDPGQIQQAIAKGEYYSMQTFDQRPSKPRAGRRTSN
jgi:Tfp pilus assembly pilus retraction ATPase PilT